MAGWQEAVAGRDAARDPEIFTPPGRPGGLGRFLLERPAPALAARIGIFLARRFQTPFRLRGTVLVARHEHLREMLRRDLAFGIAEINGEKIEEVNGGPFVLGLDRSGRLALERRALYAALAEVDLAPLRKALADEIEEKLAGADEIEAVNGYARPLAARTARRLFGLAAPPEPLFTDVVRSIFAHTFLNRGDDEAVRARAVKAGRYMRTWIEEEIARRRSAGRLGEDLLGHLLSQGIVDDDGARRTIGGMLVGSIDTTATAVAKIATIVAGDEALRSGIRRDLDSPGRLNGWCNEALRCWPHNPILLRKARAATEIGGRAVAEGETVIAWTQAAMLDPSVFPEPRRLRPDRDPAAYLHLGGGLHPCAGRRVNVWQIPMLVAGLVRKGLRRAGKIEWAGPFPDRLVVKLRGR